MLWAGHTVAIVQGAVLFAGVLSVLVIDNIEKAQIIKIILRRYTESSRSYHFTTEEHYRTDPFFFSEILEGLKSTAITTEQRKSYLQWIEILGKTRIEDIVSNKYRKSYDKAAEILGGLAECFYLLGNPQKGRNLIHEYRDGMYNRYPAFKREVRDVLLKSKIL